MIYRLDKNYGGIKRHDAVKSVSFARNVSARVCMCVREGEIRYLYPRNAEGTTAAATAAVAALVNERRRDRSEVAQVRVTVRVFRAISSFLANAPIDNGHPHVVYGVSNSG